MKKFINANIYGVSESHEFLVDNGQIIAVGNDLGDAYEAIRERAEVLASVRNGEYLFYREPRKNEIEIDFLKK